MARMFGTDGVRGIANSDSLLPELAYKLGRAAASIARESSPERSFAIIGRDTRRSGPMLVAALSAGICSAGLDVIDLAVVSTPVVAFATHQLGAAFGVMVSASHNPASDNGIKFFSAEGYKLADEAEDELERRIRIPTDTMARPIGADLGSIRADEGAVEAYIQHVVKTAHSLKGLKVVVDCGHGAAYRLSPEVLRRLGADVIPLNNRPNGMNINEQCGSTHPEELQKMVVTLQADAGIAHDGDADRCIAVDEQGEVVDGDQLMAICALDLQARGELARNTVVATVMSNLGLERLLRRESIHLIKTKVGDRYVLAEMQKGQYSLGGEQSGHIIYSPVSTTGDGILTAVQTLSVLARTRRPLSTLAGQMQRLPQWLENVRIVNMDGWESNPAIATAIRKAEVALGDQGRVLVRPSGTEPLIRVMLEGPSLEGIRTMAGQIKEVIQSELNQSEINQA